MNFDPYSLIIIKLVIKYESLDFFFFDLKSCVFNDHNTLDHQTSSALTSYERLSYVATRGSIQDRQEQLCMRQTYA